MTQVTPAKAIRALMRERRAPHPTTLPGTELRCAVRILSDREIDQARLAALASLEERCRRQGVALEHLTLVDPELFDRMKTRHILAAAYVQATDDEDADTLPLFAGAGTVEDLDAVLVSQLFDGYLDLQDAKTTKLELPEDEVERLAAAMADDDGDELLAELDITTLRRLARALARRLRPPAAREG